MQADLLGQLCMAASGLVRDIADQAAREQDEYAAGYRAGYAAAWDAAQAAAAEQIDSAWAQLAAEVRGLARVPTHAYLEILRWGGPREEFGRPRPGDYPGMCP